MRKSRYDLPENPLIRHRDVVKDKYIGQVALQEGAYRYVYGFERYESCFRSLYTLTECGRYEDYFIVQVPSEFQFPDVEAGTDEQLNEFIADFKRKYKKVEQQ